MAVSASIFAGVDLNALPAAAVVETLDYETTLAAWLAQFQAFCAQAGIDYTAILDSDPAYKILQTGAYQEVVLRQRINAAAQAVMAAYALGADLDTLAALVDVERYILTAADPAAGIAEVDESDTALRQRMVLAPQTYSVAGPEGAYVSFAKDADATVQDVSIDTPTPTDITALVMATLAANGASPALTTAMTAALAGATWPGTVTVTVLGNAANGVPTSTALANVTAKLNGNSTRPMTDTVVVNPATILDYALAATIEFLPGYDQATVLANAQAAVIAYQASNFALGAAHTLAGLNAAMFATGVKNIAITSPTADVVPTLAQAAICTGITLTPGGTET
jgi:phage-related baseplate assembly protein